MLFSRSDIGENLEKVCRAPISAPRQFGDPQGGQGLRMRRAPFFVKIAKGLRLGYYRVLRLERGSVGAM